MQKIQLVKNGQYIGQLMIQTHTLQITSTMLNIISELDAFNGKWIALGNLAPERLQSLRYVATIESIGSSTRIEGSQLSDREVKALLSNLQTGSFTNRDEQEVAGYADVMNLVYESWEHMPISENVIKQIHRQLLTYSDKDIRHRGAYKSSPNHVEAFGADGKSLGVIFATASPFDTPFRMRELVEWWREEEQSGQWHVLLRIAVFIVVFLEIHPFQDGNGRLSRVLTTLLLLQAGYSYVPYSSMESVIERNKDSYYLSLRQTQTTIRTDEPDWSPWVMFFLRSLRTQKIHLETKVEKERVSLANLPPLSLQIMTLAKDHGRITMSELMGWTGEKRGKIKYHLAQLVDDGQLTRHGAGRGVWYEVG